MKLHNECVVAAPLITRTGFAVPAAPGAKTCTAFFPLGS